MPYTTMIDAEDLMPGDRILASPHTHPGVVARVLLAADEQPDIFGRPLLRYWSRREDTGAEGFVSFGNGGRVTLVIR